MSQKVEALNIFFCSLSFSRIINDDSSSANTLISLSKVFGKSQCKLRRVLVLEQTSHDLLAFNQSIKKLEHMAQAFLSWLL